jgi:NAD-dependent SIR2 family protein deacetylase
MVHKLPYYLMLTSCKPCQLQELGLTSAEDLFDIESFIHDPRPFYRFAKNLYPSTITPSPCHHFLSWLDDNKKLLRVYTQNIDGLEELANVSKSKVVYAHGSLMEATCLQCGHKYTASDIGEDVKEGRVPLCTREKKKLPTKEETAQDNKPHGRTLRKRSFRQYSEEWNDATEGTCGGVIKPNITFFGEKIGRDVGMCLERDYKKADALIVMGTSLSV